MGAQSAGERVRGAARHGARGAQAAGQARARQGVAGAQTRHGRAGARGRPRQGRTGRPAGRPVHAWCAQLGQVGCFAAPDSVFGLVRLGIFPSHQMNTVHGEIKFFEKKNIFKKLNKIK